MRRLKTSELFPGMVTAEDVYNFNDQLILPKGLVLNDKAITKLASYSVISVKIEDETVDAPAVSLPSGPSFSQRLRKSAEFINFQAEFENDVANFKSVINDVVEKGSPLDVDKLVNETLGCIKLCAKTPNFFDILHNMREYDDATYIHSINVALICNVFARWLRMDEEEISLATISGLLHDIGKSVDHEMEGSHVQLGADLCRKYKESAIVINSVESHHGDVEPTNLISCIVQAADTISAARPGARRETLETYTNRLKQLEDITNAFKGVDKSFAIQAGREVRIMVVPDQISDDDMVLLARDISKRIEAELEYPGQIKVNVIRESRVTDYAK